MRTDIPTLPRPSVGLQNDLEFGQKILGADVAQHLNHYRQAAD